MKRLVPVQVLAIALTWLLGCLAAVAGDLQADIRAVLNDKVLSKAEVGIRVVRLGDTPASSQVVFEHNPTTPLIPASNLKLITTSAALDALGPDFKFKTRFVVKGQDLAVIGDGDPTLGDSEMLKKVGWDTLTVFNAWSARLKEKQITTAGNLLVDDSVFDEVFQHPNWPPNQGDRRYMAGVSGLNLNANCVDVTLTSNGYGQLVTYHLNPPTSYVAIRNSCLHGNSNSIILSRTPGTNQIVLGGESRGSTTIPERVNIIDPSLFAGTVLMETLTNNGVRFTGGVTRDRTIRNESTNPANGWQVLAVHETGLAMALARANKDSMNVYAEALAKRLAFEVSKPGPDGKKPPADWKAAAAAMGAFMQRVGVPENQYSFDDGSGLSKQNAITPFAVTHVLAYDFFHANRQAFLSSLSIAGQDGTLDDRFRGSDLRGRVFAKSGFVEGVSALSGFFKAKDDRWYAFSILMNGIPPKSNGTVKPLQERIVMAVDNASKR